MPIDTLGITKQDDSKTLLERWDSEIIWGKESE